MSFNYCRCWKKVNFLKIFENLRRKIVENVNIQSLEKPFWRKESRLRAEKTAQPVKLIIVAIETLKVIEDIFLQRFFCYSDSMQFSRSRTNTLGSTSATEKEKALELTREKEKKKEGKTRTPCQQTNTILTNESRQSYIQSVEIKVCVLVC